MQSSPLEDQPRPVETFTIDDGTASLGLLEQGPAQMQVPDYCVPRSLTMAIAGTLGTGLFLGSGEAISSAGPLGALMAYVLVSTVAYASLCAISEMTCFAPTSGTFPYYASRWVDEALGFAVGWNYLYTNVITIPVEISAAQWLTFYWDPNPNHQWTYLTIFCLSCFIFNIVGWRWSERAQFTFSVMKLAVLAALILISLVIILGGMPNHDRIGFRYWIVPGPFATPGFVTDPHLDRFLGFTSAIVQAAFSFQGLEIAAIAAVVTENPRTPRRNIARAIRKTFYYILVCYIIGILFAGMIVPSNDPFLLRGFSDSAQGNVTESPFIIAMESADMITVANVANAGLVTSAFSAANSFSFATSRILVSLAMNGQAPAMFNKTYKEIPIAAISFTSAFSLLAFMYFGPSRTALQWLLDLSTFGGFLSWATINLTYLSFYQGLKYHNIDRKKFIYQSVFQPWLAIWGLCISMLFVLLSSYKIFIHSGGQGIDTVVSYATVPLFLCLYVGWKIIKKTSFRRAQDRDYKTGIPSIEETETEPIKPRGFLGKVVNVVF
ncbi:hypothetical protein BDN67DRAFT_974719 [Paxillus ammoniavirescens]|nr:hypothetical protein BDN67DRAFT_974719 [Paxillus ammoniavirescens]